MKSQYVVPWWHDQLLQNTPIIFGELWDVLCEFKMFSMFDKANCTYKHDCSPICDSYHSKPVNTRKYPHITGTP